ncbi:MAG TPA: hypothetical protein VF294_07715 [Polyangiaceae bacterium]
MANLLSETCCETACSPRVAFNTHVVMASTAPTGPSNAPAQSAARHTPRCTSCGSGDVRRSHSRHLFDALVKTIGFRPYRCRMCRGRFFAKAQSANG